MSGPNPLDVDTGGRLASWLAEDVRVAPAALDEFREAAAESPERIGNAYREMLSGYEVEPAALLGYRVPGTRGRSYGVVEAKAIPFVSFCAHHFLPFLGTVDVAYLPGDGLLGIGKLPRLVRCRTQRFQLQERLVAEIVEDLMVHGGARWARAESTARHLCICGRGPREPSCETSTVFEAGEPPSAGR
jgi:GTP cyclohydrolase I